MSKFQLEKILACPKCKTHLKKYIDKGRCPKCHFEFKKENGIWHLIKISQKVTAASLKIYDKMHAHNFTGPDDGSYEILASFARGNKCLDIACGQGDIEKLSPQTVGLEFSLNALKQAKKKGIKNLVLADAQYLPFQDNSFDIAISSGNLEHFENPQKALLEMARVSKIQVLTSHKYPPIPFAPLIYKIVSFIFSVKHQAIEKPIDMKNLEIMYKAANLQIIYKGTWTLPFNKGKVIKFLPEFTDTPSCNFIISIKK